VIRPAVAAGLTNARAAYASVAGRIESAWRIETGRFHLDVTVPPNTTATVFVPADRARPSHRGWQTGRACSWRIAVERGKRRRGFPYRLRPIPVRVTAAVKGECVAQLVRISIAPRV